MTNKDAAGIKPIKLPPPLFAGCGTVFDALKKRSTSRAIGNKKISRQMLSDILWAAAGINRQTGPFGVPGLTAGSASNSQEICVYAATAKGIYLYEPHGHKLLPVLTGDYRVPGMGRTGQAGANAGPIDLCRGYRQIQERRISGTWALQRGGSEILLLCGHRVRRTAQRLSGSRRAGAIRMVSQLQ